MEMKVEKSVSIEDGEHKGVITAIEYRTEPYKYTDIVIKDDKTGFELKYGCPTNASENSKLMLCVGEFADITPGITVDVDRILIDRKVKFMTLQENKDGKKFVRIVSGSVKPLEE